MSTHVAYLESLDACNDANDRRGNQKTICGDNRIRPHRVGKGECGMIFRKYSVVELFIILLLARGLSELLHTAPTTVLEYDTTMLAWFGGLFIFDLARIIYMKLHHDPRKA